MLRIIVISLVLTNLLLLGFQASKPDLQEQTPMTRSVTGDTDVPTMHLFEEMIGDQALMSGTRQCFSLGPFHSAEDRDQLRMQLKGKVAGYSERQTQALVERGYWVYIPPYDSLLEANQGLISVRALGLEDIAIIYDGEWENAISLGYFRRQENANRRKRQLEERNIEVQVRVSRHEEPRYWLDYEQKPGAELLKVDFRELPNDFRQRMLPCPELGFFSEADILPEEAAPAAGVVSTAPPPATEAEGDGD
jgi:hypothetical protein